MKGSTLDRRLLAGAIAGTLATLPMSAFMLLAQRAGWLTEQAPEGVTDRAMRRVTGHDVDGSSLDLLTAAAHVGFGAGAGALYTSTVGRVRIRPVPAGLLGALYGTLVWVVSYWGVLPALHLMPSPPRDQRRRPLVMLVAHWIYGASLGLLAARSRMASATALGPGRHARTHPPARVIRIA